MLADQLANEATVEAIVRKRTLEGEFRVVPYTPLPPTCAVRGGRGLWAES